ncbi:MAG: type II CRISPR RNA-guided endonuclease Cas9 [Bacteroidales bacterium]|nr:type II CRISPR RNA-guided endonuclease Cas9 [Bacteroidales bacterium]
MKKILGLDLGTNSIGWAVVNEAENELINIEAAGSRIIPLSADILGNFEKGNSVSQTANRTNFRGVRRLRQRYLLRRERLHRVLDVLNFFPEHYANQLDKYGHFLNYSEPKLAWNNGQFLFMDSFNEMLNDFQKYQPNLVADNKKIPLDWTIYYLRKKALNQAITKQELAWILLQFNQKRGYNQLRDEEVEENKNQKVEYYSLKVVAVEDSGDKKGKDIWYNVKLENGWIYRRSSSIPLDWVGKIKDFIVTTDLNDDGSVKLDKDGKEKRSFRAPKEDDWTLLKKKTEHFLDNSEKTVGENIYNSLLKNPDQKIIGKFIRTIERKYYKDEIKAIINKQKDYIPELKNSELYKNCIEELYPSNEDYRKSIANRDFTYLLVDDVLFYQRPLKTKKSTIADCPYETHKDIKGNEFAIKCIAKSNPFFQEFRLLQFVSNLRIFQREKTSEISDKQLELFTEKTTIKTKIETDVDVTNCFIKSEDDLINLFEYLNNRSEIKQDTLLTDYFKIKRPKGKDSKLPYRWNYVEDKTYPCNKTRAAILAKLSKEDKSKLTRDLEYKLWHLLYSVNSKTEIDSVFADNKQSNTKGIYYELLQAGFSSESIENLKKTKFEEKDYGSYSEKAIKKLLSLMRFGKYWSQDNIDKNTLERIDKITTGEYDEKIKNRVREKTINLSKIQDFRGLPVWLACYIVYDRHSEINDIQKWNKPEEIDKWLKDFKQHSLRNPIVEQVVTETMRTVRDIWKQVGNINEIHIELGRDLKNPADKRAKMTSIINDNENTNLRIKAMLMEFQNPEFEIKDVRPYSPSQQEILRIYEEGALQQLSEKDDDFDFISKISKSPQITKSDIIRYKCWLEQKYRSPYTGEVINLSNLFTSAYEIEHIIPQSRYFDDSFSNKVICEAEVNKLKDRQLAYEFIKDHKGEKVTLTGGKIVTILSVDDYQTFVKTNYSRNKTKMKKLLMDDIPDGFIERQMNDSRYISKYIKGILSNIVREKDENGNLEQEAVSKNLISCNGSVTDQLKKDWGMNDVWNRIIISRFKRLNELTNSEKFTTLNTSGEEIPYMPLDLQKGFNKKRIDHRHHAMDAIVIACTTRNHVNLLNNESAMSKNKENRIALQHKLRRYEDVVIDGKSRKVAKEFIKPWETFTQDAQNVLENIIVSFKQNLRVINKTVNKYQHYNKDGKKVLISQKKGDSWAIRKSLHKDTTWGEVNLCFEEEVDLKVALKNPSRIVLKDLKNKILELKQSGKDEKAIIKYFNEHKDEWQEANKKIKVYYYTQEKKNKKGEIKDHYYATRFLSDLVGYFAKVTKYDEAIKKIEGITDKGIQKILKNHLEAKGNNPVLAFCADGIEEMNKNIVSLNDGKQHKPIYKIRRFEKGEKFAIGQLGNKNKKFVEGDKGTNLFFLVYESIKEEDYKKRSFVSVPLNLVIDCQKKYLNNWTFELDKILKENDEVSNDSKLLFILSPNDLVYLPKNGDTSIIDKSRIYKMVSSSGNQCFFIKENVAKSIVDKVEFSTSNKMEKAITGEMIKEICIPIKIDRLGNIIEYNG